MNDLLILLRAYAPTWTSACWRYAGTGLLGESGGKRMIPVVAKGEALRYCTECSHGFRVLVTSGQAVPQLCPYCRSPLRWAYDEEPEIVFVAPSGSASVEVRGLDALNWSLDFERWCNEYRTAAIPEPSKLILLWAAGHRQGQAPEWGELARAYQAHLGVKRPHHHALPRLWHRLRASYEGK
jgi:hypothetical protein